MYAIRSYYEALQQLDQVIQQNASSAEQLAATSEELSAQAEQLQAGVAFFRTGEQTRAAPPLTSVKKVKAVAGAKRKDRITSYNVCYTKLLR